MTEQIEWKEGDVAIYMGKEVLIQSPGRPTGPYISIKHSTGRRRVSVVLISSLRRPLGAEESE